MIKKELTAEHAETAELFLPKDQKHKSFCAYFILPASSQLSAVYGYFLISGEENLSSSVSSADEDKKKTEEETENAEIIS
jgi:hypothetical protein